MHSLQSDSGVSGLRGDVKQEGQGASCYGLNVEGPPKVPVLNVWSPEYSFWGGGGGGTFSG